MQYILNLFALFFQRRKAHKSYSNQLCEVIKYTSFHYSSWMEPSASEIDTITNERCLGCVSFCVRFHWLEMRKGIAHPQVTNGTHIVCLQRMFSIIMLLYLRFLYLTSPVRKYFIKGGCNGKGDKHTHALTNIRGM